MYSLKDRYGSSLEVRTKPILAAKRRRQLYPFFFHMGPVALSITSVLLIGLMAVLYLNQLGEAIAANQSLQDLRNQQVELKKAESRCLAYHRPGAITSLYCTGGSEDGVGACRSKVSSDSGC